MMQILVWLGFLLVAGVWAASDCPDADTTLAKWSSSGTWDDGLVCSDFFMIIIHPKNISFTLFLFSFTNYLTHRYH